MISRYTCNRRWPKEVQDHIHEIIDAINWELKYNRTTAHISLTAEQIEEVKKNPEAINKYWGKMMVYHPAGMNSILNQGEGNKGLVSLIQGKPLLDILAMYLDYSIDRGFNITGYNSPQGTREHGTNKTSEEVSINMQNDLLTTQLKKEIRTKQLNRLIKKTGKVLGIEDIDCRIEIRGMSTMEQAKFNTDGELHYIIWETLSDEDRDKLRALLQNKNIYLFNLNFDVSQLKHAGFKVDSNKWYDIALLARITDNDKLDKEVMNLSTLGLNYLGYSDKKNYIEVLKKKYKVRSKTKLFMTPTLEHDEDFKAYALNDVTLLIKLHRYLKDNSSNYGLWKGEISTLAYQQWTRGFNGVKVNIKDLQVRIQELGDLRTKLLTMLPDLTMGTDSVSNAKGWNSPKLVDKWLRDTFDSNTLSHLTINDKSQLYRFDAEGRETKYLRY